MSGHANDPVAELIRRHAVDSLRAYGGNLAFAGHIVRNGWLPAENEPAIEEHLATLRRHLAHIGHPEGDSFLLRLALTVPGMQRGIVPPLMVLEANRGGFSARRQDEAARHIERLREALAIGRWFVPSLSAETQQAIAELSDVCQRQSRADDADWLRWFGTLSPRQAAQLAKRAVECLDSDADSVKEIGTEILQRLAVFREPPLSEPCCRALVQRRVFWPSSLYRDSGEEVARQLISLIAESSETLSLHHLLLALAWTRSAAAHQAFRQWTDEPPGWASGLYVPPKEYVHTAGWCLDDEGQRRDLISKSCFRLVPGEEAAPRGVGCRTRIDEDCPACGGPLCWLFDFSRIIGKYFPGEFAEAPRKVLCCLHCSCYAPVFSTYRGDGSGHWHSGNGPCKFDHLAAGEPCVRTVDEMPCPPFACAEPFALEDASTLGGMPMRLPHAEFPRCIECGRVMAFLAQHDNGPLGEEGIYYAFFCAPCHIAAVSYQQT